MSSSASPAAVGALRSTPCRPTASERTNAPTIMVAERASDLIRSRGEAVAEERERPPVVEQQERPAAAGA